MKHPYDEAARIVNLHVPRHILSIDRARLRDDIYQAIIFDRQSAACGELFPAQDRQFDCTLRVGHPGAHIHNPGPGELDPVVAIGRQPHEQPVVDEDRCNWRWGGLRCERVDGHDGECVFDGKRHQSPIGLRCSYIHPDGGRCQLNSPHVGPHVVCGQLLCGEGPGTCNLVRGHGGPHSI